MDIQYFRICRSDSSIYWWPQVWYPSVLRRELFYHYSLCAGTFTDTPNDF